MKPPMPSTSPLANPQHEAFAREVVSGRNAAQAYAAVYGVENQRVASSAGHRLLRRPCVATRVKSLQEAAAQGVAMDLREILGYLARIVRTPAGAVIPSSDLCVRVKTTPTGPDTWMPNKLAALQMAARLQGFFQKTATAIDPPEGTSSDGLPSFSHEQHLALIAAKRADTLRRTGQVEEASRNRPAEPRNNSSS